MSLLSHMSYPYKRRGGRSTSAVNTLSLAHFDGDDGATTTEDQIFGITWLLASGAQIDTAQFQFGTSSLLFGADSNAQVSSWTSPVTGNWTIECFIRVATAGPNLSMNQAQDFIVANIKNGSLAVTIKKTDLTTIYSFINAIGISTNTWTHFAVVREGTSYSTFLNGSRLDTATQSDNMGATTGLTILETLSDAGGLWMDEFRVSKTARYSGATYTVPVAAFTVD